MSAPAGWHLQPDGQERFWDGTRGPTSSGPRCRATPPPRRRRPRGPARSTRPRRSTSTHTQAIPAPQAAPERLRAGLLRAERLRAAGAGPAGLRQPGYPQHGLPAAGYPQTGYPQPGYPQTGYGAPGTQPYAPPPRQGNGLAKGCLIAALIGVLVLGAAVVGGHLRLQPGRRHDQRDLPLGPAHRPAERLPVRPAHRGPGRSRSTSPSVTASSCPARPSSRGGRWSRRAASRSSRSPG